jgi:xylan 1,4-beta-xylosidase
MKIKIDSARSAGKLRNFFSHIHFHPTDAIEDDWGRRILDRIAADGAARTVRLYTMLEDIVKIGEDGRFTYDFRDNDTRLDYLTSKGFDILLSYNFIPPCISSDRGEVGTVCKNPTRYKGKFIATAPPRDYREWEEICRVYTEHIVERYGRERVASWMLQCYNEPDENQFFMKGAASDRDRAEAYCYLYKHFERGVHAVLPEAKIGGPALGSHFDFLGIFLDFVKREELPLDYIFFHTYGVHPDDLRDGGLRVSSLEKKARAVIDFVTERGFGDRIFVNDEWGAATCGYYNSDENPLLMFRETEVFSAYYAKMIARYADANLPIDKMMICLSGQHEMKTDFSGFRGFFTLNGYPKPIYNAYVLAARLGGERLSVDGILDDKLSVIATRRADGTLAIMLAYADECFSSAPCKLDLTIELPGSVCDLWRIDAENASAMKAYREESSPDHPTPEERDRIGRAASVSPKRMEFNKEITLQMTANSVVLLETKEI